MKTNFNRVTKEIITIGPLDNPILILKHIMIVNRPYQDKSTLKWDYIRFDFEYTTKNRIKDDEINLYLKKSSDYISIESKNQIDQTSLYNKKISHKIYQKDFIELKKSLEKVVEWFKEDLYRRDKNGSIIDLKEEYNKLVSICFSKFTNNAVYISFQPSLAFDNVYTYPGILINTEKGMIGVISYDEFLLLKLNLDEYINNFNLFSNQLLELTYLQSIDRKDINPTEL